MDNDQHDRPPQGQIFSEETMASLRELGAVLGDIRRRLIAEGYTFVDGEFIPPKKEEKKEPEAARSIRTSVSTSGISTAASSSQLALISRLQHDISESQVVRPQKQGAVLGDYVFVAPDDDETSDVAFLCDATKHSERSDHVFVVLDSTTMRRMPQSSAAPLEYCVFHFI